MCSIISDAIKKFENQEEKEKVANDALNVMMELAKQQTDAFYLKITNGGVDTKTIPIDQILHKDYVVRCDVSSGNVGAISSIIKKSFSNFANGSIVDGIASIIDGGLDLVLGSFSGSVAEHEFYTISAGNQAGIRRIDIRLYAYKFSSKQLTEIAKNVMCCMVVISSVSPKAVNEGSLRNIVQDQFPIDKQEAILKTLLDAHQKALSGWMKVRNYFVPIGQKNGEQRRPMKNEYYVSLMSCDCNRMCVAAPSGAKGGVGIGIVTLVLD